MTQEELAELCVRLGRSMSGGQIRPTSRISTCRRSGRSSRWPGHWRFRSTSCGVTAIPDDLRVGRAASRRSSTRCLRHTAPLSRRSDRGVNMTPRQRVSAAALSLNGESLRMRRAARLCVTKLTGHCAPPCYPGAVAQQGRVAGVDVMADDRDARIAQLEAENCRAA